MLFDQLEQATLENVQVRLTKASDIQISPVSWVWDGWLAQGKLHILAGVPEAGKTQIALDVAARISRGGVMPDGSRAPLGSSIIWSGEDDPADTLVPRLIRAGANLDRIRIVTGTNKGPFDPSEDMGSLWLGSSDLTDLRLLVLDPIVSAVTGDSNQASHVRRGLQPIVDFAARAKCAVLGISHLTKGTAGRDPLERVTGSGAFGAVPRLVWFASKGSEQRVLCRAKSNISESGGGFHYTVAPREVAPGTRVSGIEWGEMLTGSAAELIARNECSGQDLSEARAFLMKRLSTGSASSREIDEEAKRLGIGRSELKKAKESLGVISRKLGFNEGWILKMRVCDEPHEDSEDPEGVLTSSSDSSSSCGGLHAI